MNLNTSFVIQHPANPRMFYNRDSVHNSKWGMLESATLFSVVEYQKAKGGSNWIRVSSLITDKHKSLMADW